MNRKFLAAIVMSGILFVATACNTVKGVGRDLESVGQAGSDALR